MRKQIFVLFFILILCEAYVKTENHNLKGEKGYPIVKTRKANFIDNKRNKDKEKDHDKQKDKKNYRQHLQKGNNKDKNKKLNNENFQYKLGLTKLFKENQGVVIPPIKQWQSLDQFEQSWGPGRKVGAEVEYKNDDSIKGLQEYGYGFWFRFVWNGASKLVDKPAWLALSRLTINENYEGDGRQEGDRQLVVWVGSPFFHFVASQAGNSNIWNNVNYNQMLDGQWNLLYYSYKRTDKGGKVLGHILFDGKLKRSTEFPNINLPPVQDYLYLSVGSSGSKLLNNYYSFNGQIAGVRLVLGEGGLIETIDDLKKFGGKKPDLPTIPQVKKTIFEEQQVTKREQGQVAPVEFKDEFAGADEYVVSIWFKWSTIERVSWEVIYSLTYNEPAIRANHLRPGDRVLSMYQYADHRIFFSSYSTPDSHDTFAQVYSGCLVPAMDQTSWVYGYYAYSRKSPQLISYLKTRSTDCEKKIAALHRLPKYFGLYLGKDGIHTPYNGKFAHVYLWSGDGSYREKDYLQFQPYLAGASGIQTKPYIHTYKTQLIDLAFDQELNIDFIVDKVNGQSAYGYGFWAKYLTAYPKRLLVKPQWLEIIRFTIIKDNEDKTNLGDRALAIFLGAEYYHFTTYNQANNLPSINQNVDYGDQLEAQATAFVKFGNSEEVKRVPFPSIFHRPIEDYVRIHLGKEFQYQGFNGQIIGLQVRFGEIGYIHDTDELEAAIKSSFGSQVEKLRVATKLSLQDAERVKIQNEAPQYVEWPDQYKFSLEYSIFGWFRYDAKELASPKNVLMRLTNNEPAYIQEFGQVGDRTLFAMLQARQYVFATYTLGKIDTDSVANIIKVIPFGNNLGLWTYTWAGYSWPKRQASAIIKFQTETKTETFTEVLHMQPKFLQFFVGSDGMLGGWIGPIAKVGAIFGIGAYINPSKGNFEQMLPDVIGFNYNPQFEWKPEFEGIWLVPKSKDPGYDVILKGQVKGISDYGYGLWTRWLMTIPERVADKAPFHHLIRLTNTEKYEDNVELGNRVLAVWVGKGYYQFTTYNKAQNKVSISQNVDYSDYLEGNWNYLYFSFTKGDNKPKAVGFVLFGDLPEEQIQRVEFVDITHSPINGYARITIANNEFSYPAFNGMITDVRLYFGKGFIGSKEQFLKEITSQYPRPSVILPMRKDINILNDKKEFFQDDEKAPVKGYYDQYQGIKEYAVSGWFISKRSGSADQLQTLFRLTINAPEYLNDKQNAGDRTLSAFATKQKYILSTYDYGNLDTNDDDQNDINKEFNIESNGGDWTFLYFGYNYKERKAFGYALYYTNEDSTQYNDLKHFVPNKLWFYLGGGDKLNPGFEGTLYYWNLHLGEGAFTNKPITFIEVWPYEPKDLGSTRVLSALLVNQGLNSVKITKTESFSRQIVPAKGHVQRKVKKVKKRRNSSKIKKGTRAKSIQLTKDQKKQLLSGSIRKKKNYNYIIIIYEIRKIYGRIIWLSMKDNKWH